MNSFSMRIRRRLGLTNYGSGDFRVDLIAGAIVCALVIPQSISYAQMAGLPPQAGVIASFVAPLAYALFGTSRQVIASPTSALAAISAAALVTLAVSDGAPEVAAALAILAGLFYLLMAWRRLGFLSQFISPAVQIGFLAGIGITIILGQIPKLMGFTKTDGNAIDQVRGIVDHLGDIHGWTTLIGVTGLGLLIISKRVAPGFPIALILVVASTIVVKLFDLSERGVAVVGDISRTVPTPAIPTLSINEWLALVPAAIAVVVVGYSESISVARRFAQQHGYSIKPDRELVALGAANAFTGLFQGMVVAGGASQSAANDRSGARTVVSSMTLSALSLLALLFLMPIFRDLPLATLAAIVIGSAIGLVDLAATARVRLVRSNSFWLFLLAALAVLLLGIFPGLLVAVSVSLVLLLGQLSRPGIAAFRQRADVPAPSSSNVESLVIKTDYPLLYINADWLRDKIQEVLDEGTERPSEVVLDLAQTHEFDVAGVDFIVAIEHELTEMGIRLRLINVSDPIREILDRAPEIDVGELLVEHSRESS